MVDADFCFAVQRAQCGSYTAPNTNTTIHVPACPRITAQDDRSDNTLLCQKWCNKNAEACAARKQTFCANNELGCVLDKDGMLPPDCPACFCLSKKKARWGSLTWGPLEKLAKSQPQVMKELNGEFDCIWPPCIAAPGVPSEMILTTNLPTDAHGKMQCPNPKFTCVNVDYNVDVATLQEGNSVTIGSCMGDGGTGQGHSLPTHTRMQLFFKDNLPWIILVGTVVVLLVGLGITALVRRSRTYSFTTVLAANAAARTPAKQRAALQASKGLREWLQKQEYTLGVKVAALQGLAQQNPTVAMRVAAMATKREQLRSKLLELGGSMAKLAR
jgi:hypothetical protein